MSFILGCGIEKDIPDNEGYTPIDLAKDNNHEDCMKLFYIKTPNLLVHTYMYYECMYNNIVVVEVLSMYLMSLSHNYFAIHHSVIFYRIP